MSRPYLLFAHSLNYKLNTFMATVFPGLEIILSSNTKSTAPHATGCHHDTRSSPGVELARIDLSGLPHQRHEILDIAIDDRIRDERKGTSVAWRIGRACLGKRCATHRTHQWFVPLALVVEAREGPAHEAPCAERVPAVWIVECVWRCPGPDAQYSRCSKSAVDRSVHRFVASKSTPVLQLRQTSL